MNLEIRNATEKDSPLIAWNVFAAINEECDNLDKYALLCKKEDSLYSWKRTRIAVVDGVDAGCLISYPGNEYLELRKKTWSEFWSELDKDYLDAIELETLPGEYYLDSMALLPQYRGLGIGKTLLLDGVQKGKTLGCEYATLLADVEHTGLVKYYFNMGFEQFGQMNYLGKGYVRMRMKCL